MKTGASEAERLRREIGGRRSRRGPLPKALRERGMAFARARGAAGMTAGAMARELGISERTAERWMGEKARASLVPVRVVDVGRATSVVASTAVLTTPSGLRIEGLDLDAVCTLVMRCG